MSGFREFARRVPGARAAWRFLKRIQQPAAASGKPSPHTLSSMKSYIESSAARDLSLFLSTEQRLALPTSPNPTISILIVIYNRAELTFRCLRSLSNAGSLPFEVVVVDNGSTDSSELLFQRIDGVRYLRQSTNLHFLRGTNLAAQEAKGSELLLLNNDTELAPGALWAAHRRLHSSERIGAVGGRLILADGTLQEAGSLCFSDGTCYGFGRGDDPDRAPYQFARPVDYCSGAFLLTRRSLWAQCDGLDERYAPAYYEETDYCLRLWEMGMEVWYEPEAIVQHFEFASSSHSDAALALQTRNRSTFLARHHATLAERPRPSSEAVRVLASRPTRPKVLWIDERIPHDSYGAGYPRARQIVRALDGLGAQVTVIPAIHEDPDEQWSTIYRSVPRTVEVLARTGYGPNNFRKLAAERSSEADLIFISRPDTMRAFRGALSREQLAAVRDRIVYDAEAIFALRAMREAEILHKPLSSEQLNELLTTELQLAEGIAAITTVSPAEAQEFSHRTTAEVLVLSHAVSVEAPAPLATRSGVLFVGAIYGNGGPNFDSLSWYFDNVLPQFAKPIAHTIAGRSDASILHERAPAHVQFLGVVPSLTPLYRAHRVFIAPTRYSAGIPLKVLEAVAAGIPCVLTEHLATQLGLSGNHGFLVAHSPAEFADAVRTLNLDDERWTAAITQQQAWVQARYSEGALRTVLRQILARTSSRAAIRFMKAS